MYSSRQKFFVLAVVTALLFTACSSEQKALEAEATVQFTAEKEEAPLPAWQTDDEKKRVEEGRVVLRNTHVSTPPAGSLYSPAEYAAMEGVVVHVYGQSSFYDYFGIKIKAIVDAGAVPYILVSTASEQSTVVNNVLTPYGVNQADVSFVMMDNDAFWSRDFGPWHVYEDGQRVIIDHKYYSTRPDDDAVPVNLGTLWDEDVYSTPFYTEGGNFMTDGLGTCWASTGVFGRNSMSQADIENVYKDYVGCNTITFVEPIPGEGTTHIDMFSKVLNQDTILVGYSNASLGASAEEIAHLDAVAETYRNSPKPDGNQWNIVRIPMSFGSTWQGKVYYTHTNALVLNGHMLVPTYGRGTDQEALDIYRQAIPEYTIVGIDANDTIPLGGAIHCTTMQVPVKQYAACGDGVISGQEQCEPTYLKGATCEDFGYTGGVLGCSDQCQYDLTACEGINTCGDNVVDEGEVCDGDSVNCVDLGKGYVSGTAICNASCSGYDESQCEMPEPVCGDDETNGTEVCDGDSLSCADLNPELYSSGTATCFADCTGWDETSCELKNSCENQPCSADGGAIPDNTGASLSRTITVHHFAATLDTINVAVTVTHPYQSDLTVVLTSPQGTTATLHDQTGEGANLALNLSLADFASENPEGEWTLTVTDSVTHTDDGWNGKEPKETASAGTLESWTLQLVPAAANLCGNGLVDAGEMCDGGFIACSDLDNRYDGGTAHCLQDCSGYDTVNCSAAPFCGDNEINGTEICDGNTEPCSSIDSSLYLSGDAVCNADCGSYDLSSCIEKDICGNNVPETGEVCDGGSIACSELSTDYISGNAPCEADCSGYNPNACVAAPVCGNGTIEQGETCETGDTINCADISGASWTAGTATCSSTCSWDEGSCTKDDGWQK